MSDHSISIVPRQSNYPDNQAKAKEILNWLVAEDIVKPMLSDCILGSNNGYAVSAGAKLITTLPDQLPFNLVINGLEIITERQVFDTGETYADELICPNCLENILFENWDLNPWNDQVSDNLTCPLCGHETGIHNFTFDPEWGFSNLGFRFWNWPDFTDDFTTKFKQKLGCDISIVYQHI